MSPIGVLLVEDHPVVSKGVADLLANTVDIKLVGEARSGGDALRLAQDLQPDVILLDMELPDMHGTEVARQLRERQSPAKILAFSGYDDPVFISELLRIGAAGYLVKEEAPDKILDAIRAVAHGETGWYSQRVEDQVVAAVEKEQRGTINLTARENQVLKLVVDGKTNREIGYELGISEKTVEKYLEAIFNKLGVTSRVEAAVLAVRDGLV